MHAADSSVCGGRKLVVCCPPGFYRRGNVQIVCERFGVDLVDTRKELVEKVRAKLQTAVDQQSWT